MLKPRDDPFLTRSKTWTNRRAKQRDVPAGRGKMQKTCMRPNITYDHAKKIIVKQLYTINAIVLSK